jgi:hypothetical protein
MTTTDEHFLPLYDKDGALHTVMLSAELWAAIEDRVRPLIDEALGRPADASRTEELPEPLADWELLKSFWDFKYPVDTDVTCSVCGNATADWAADEPRKFRLRAANLGGLVNFECLHCKARVIKRHFRDHIDVQVQPHHETKTFYNEAKHPPKPSGRMTRR